MEGCQGLPRSSRFLAVAHGRIGAGVYLWSKKQKKGGFGEISSGIPGGRVGLKSGLAQELWESLAWSRLEPWRVDPPGEVTEREAAERRQE